jgi:dethiobiotin synthetase
MSSPRFLVTGTDTGVGKTEVACALASLMAARGLTPFVFKPYESGLGDRRTPPDALALQRAAGRQQPLQTVSLYRYRHPLAPAVAAALERKKSPWTIVMRTAQQWDEQALVVEGAGGLLSPLDARHTAVDLALGLHLPVLLVARNALGTLNHVALCLDALRHRRVRVAAVLLCQSQRQSDRSRQTNWAWLSKSFESVPFLKAMPFIADARQRRKTLMRILAPLM